MYADTISRSIEMEQNVTKMEQIVRMNETVEVLGHLDCENADPHTSHEWTDENGKHYCYGIYREE
jgi:hypothetical protein